MQGKKQDLTGQRFARLSVLAAAPSRNYNARWLCVCECGELTVVFAKDLLGTRTQSCGCLQVEKATKHGMVQSLLYSTWKSMLLRCTNKNAWDYKYYGGRGITVHGPWFDAATFIADVTRTIGIRSAGFTLDRIDNDRGYEPGNIRWATAKQQRANQHRNGATT